MKRIVIWQIAHFEKKWQIPAKKLTVPQPVVINLSSVKMNLFINIFQRYKMQKSVLSILPFEPVLIVIIGKYR